MESSAVEVLGQDPARRWRHRRRDLGLVALVVCILLTAAATYAGQHYRVDLIDDYRAGYNSTVPDLEHPTNVDGTPCRAAILEAHPEVEAIWEAETWPDYLVAFDYGCSSKRTNLPYDPWHLHQMFSDH